MNNKELANTTNPTSLLFSLYHHSQQPAQNDLPIRNYKELNKFRQKVEEQKCGPHHQPYQASQKRALSYKAVFFALGILFLFLSYFLYSHTMIWSGNLFFVDFSATKTVICLFTLLLSGLSFILGLAIHGEREAVHKITHRAKNKLRRIYSYKRDEYGLSAFSTGLDSKKNAIAKRTLHEAIAKVNDSKKAVCVLLRQIRETKGLDKATLEKLFNQAILEFNDKLHSIIYEFKNKLTDLLA